MKKQITLIPVMAACVVMIILTAGHLAYEDEVNQGKHYCEMVSSGAWPDYDDSINCD